jgi:hypothetical protein
VGEASDIDRWAVCINTGRFIILSVTTNIYKKETNGPNLMEWFTTVEKPNRFFVDN